MQNSRGTNKKLPPKCIGLTQKYLFAHWSKILARHVYLCSVQNHLRWLKARAKARPGTWRQGWKPYSPVAARDGRHKELEEEQLVLFGCQPLWDLLMSSLLQDGYGTNRLLTSHLLAPWGHVHRERRFFCHLASEVMSCYLPQILLAETVAKMLPSSEVGGLNPAFTKGMLPPHNTEGQGRVG